MAERRIEEIVVDVSIFTEGLGMVGVATEFKPTSIEVSTIESESSPAGKMELAYGAVEAMEMEYTLGEHNPTVHTAMGKLNDAQIIAKKSSKQGTETVNVEWIHKGQIVSSETDAIKRGEKTKNTIKMKVHYYKKSINGKVVCEVDKLNGICKLDGVTDILQEARNFVGRG